MLIDFLQLAAAALVGAVLSAWIRRDSKPAPEPALIQPAKSDLWINDLVGRMADEANIPVSIMARACKTLRRHPEALRRMLDFPVFDPPPTPTARELSAAEMV